mgnify:FL=1
MSNYNNRENSEVLGKSFLFSMNSIDNYTKDYSQNFSVSVLQTKTTLVLVSLAASSPVSD